MTKTAEKPTVDPLDIFVNLLQEYNGSMTREYSHQIAGIARELKKGLETMYAKKHVNIALKETPNISDLSPYVNYLLATDNGSDDNVRYNLENRTTEEAGAFLDTYIKVATRTEKNPEGNQNLRMSLWRAYEFFDDCNYNEWKTLLNEDSKKATKIAQQYIQGIIELTGESEKYSFDLSAGSSEEYREKLECAIEKAREEFTIDKYKNGLISIESKITDMLERTGIEKKAEKVIDRLRQAWAFSNNTCNPEDIDPENINYRNIAFSLEREVLQDIIKARLKYLKTGESMTEGGIILPKGKDYSQETAEALKKIRSYGIVDSAWIENLDKVICNQPALERLNDVLSVDIKTEHLGNYVYTAIAHCDKRKAEEFNGIMKKINDNVKSRINRGENQEGAVISELGRVFGRENPYESLLEEFPYAVLMPLSEIGKYESLDIRDVAAEKLDVKRDYVDAEVKNILSAKNPSVWARIKKIFGFAR